MENVDRTGWCPKLSSRRTKNYEFFSIPSDQINARKSEFERSPNRRNGDHH